MEPAWCRAFPLALSEHTRRCICSDSATRMDAIGGNPEHPTPRGPQKIFAGSEFDYIASRANLCPTMIKILTGDCRTHLATIRDASIDCIIADPPYGQTSLQWDKRVSGWASAARRVLKPSGSMWVFGSTRYFMETVSEFSGWKLSHDIVWEKHNGASFFNDRFRGVHELVAHFYRGDAPWGGVYKQPQFSNDATKRTVRRKQTPAHWTGARAASHYVSEDGGPRLMRSVLYIRSEHGHAEHPTQKPADLVELLMLYACPPNGIVLDPFAGSGTVGQVANSLNRHAILIEQNPKYVEMIQRRCNIRPHAALNEEANK